MAGPAKRVDGRAIPLWISDVDTDQIMPKQFLKRTDREGYGDLIFYNWRKSGTSPFSDPRFEGAAILLAGANFGCGSSREHAVWGLRQWGIRAIVAASFADIFRANCTGEGIVTATIPGDLCRELCELVVADPDTWIEVNLTDLYVDSPLGRHACDIDSLSRKMLLRGARQVDLTLELADHITAYEQQRPGWLPSMRRGDVDIDTRSGSGSGKF